MQTAWNCVVVTRGGWGDVWGFENRASAAMCPIYQEGDAIVAGPGDVFVCWNYLFLPRMCSEVLHDPAMDARLRDAIDSAADPHMRDARCRVGAQEIWDVLSRAAKAPPSDPVEVVRRIVEDRRLYDEWYRREQTRRSSVTEANKGGTAAGTEGAKAEEPKTLAGFALTAKIKFGKDKDGKHYNATDNNPKRAGSKSGDRFAKYKDGMSVKEASEAGITAADLKWDSSHGFIAVA